MGNLTDILLEYGVLGLWVAFSIYRERQLMRRMDEIALRHRMEREEWNNERTRWLRTLGRKLGDNTFMEVQDN